MTFEMYSMYLSATADEYFCDGRHDKANLINYKLKET